MRNINKAWTKQILGGPGSGKDFTIGMITAVGGGQAWGHKKLV